MLSKEIDAVSVCTWNAAHAPCTIAALEAGKHVLCEAYGYVGRGSLEMKKAAEKSGKLLMIGFVRRYGNDCRIRKSLSTKILGDIYYAKPTIQEKSEPRRLVWRQELSGGGPLIDLGVHVIDFVKYVMGNPKPVSVYGATFEKLGSRSNIKGKKIYKAASATDNDICNVEDLATAMIRFDNGAVLVVETSFSLHTKKGNGTIELFGTKGGAKLDPELELYTEINDYMADIALDAETALSFDGLFQNEINHFISCIKDGTKCESPAQDGVEIMQILDAIYESARTGHRSCFGGMIV